MRFSDYAEEWLYGADGYYTKAPAVGKRGDFFTSVSVSRFFGGAIANNIIKLIRSGEFSEHLTVCEVGAHQGYLMADIVQFIYTLAPDLIRSITFAVVEPIESLRQIQQSYFVDSFADEIKIAHYEKPSDLMANELFIYANELFDAFKFELINNNKMAFVDNHEIYWDEISSDLMGEIKNLNLIRGEYFVGFKEFASSFTASKIKALFFDYGEFVPRGDFSARIYQQHNSYPIFEKPNLKEFYKSSDLTADVAFDQLDIAFKKAGFTRDFLKTQSVALIDMGLMDLMQIVLEKAGKESYQKEIGNIRALIDPAMLGERFKAVSYSKL